MTKSGGGKNLMGREDVGEDQEENSISGDNMYSMDQSNNIKQGGNKRKKITKTGTGKGSKRMG